MSQDDPNERQEIAARVRLLTLIGLCANLGAQLISLATLEGSWERLSTLGVLLASAALLPTYLLRHSRHVEGVLYGYHTLFCLMLGLSGLFSGVVTGDVAVLMQVSLPLVSLALGRARAPLICAAITAVILCLTAASWLLGLVPVRSWLPRDILLESYGFQLLTLIVVSISLYLVIRRAEEARSRERLARQFISFWNHEVGGALSGALGLLPLLRERSAAALAGDDGLARLVGLLEGAVGETDELVRDIAILTREGTLSIYQQETLDLAELVEQASAVVARSPRPARLQLDLRRPLVARGAPAMLARALETALRNALEALEQSGDTISVSAAADGAHVCVRVEDNGPGFRPAVLARLQELLEQQAEGALSWVSDKSWGSGRGLPLIAQVARLHGGALALGNRAGGAGAWVELRLPLEGVGYRD